jgi:hypothetical protein
MKRDIDLCRSILLAIEELDDETWSPQIAEAINAPHDAVGHNIAIMFDAGFLIGQDDPAKYGPGSEIHVLRMTWAGHEFLDAARDAERWAKTKAVTGAVGGVAFDVVKSVLTKLSTQAVFERLGYRNLVEMYVVV